MKGNRRLLTALRRGIGLGLALVAVWGISLTADFGALGERLSALGARPGLAVSLLTAQMGELPGQDRALTGWGRLLLDSSALMRAGSVAGCVVRDTETYLPYYRRDVGRVLKKAEENPHPKKEWAR